MSDAMDVDVRPLEIRFQPGRLWDLAAVSLTAAFLRYKITYVRQNGTKGENINALVLELSRISVPTPLRKTIDELYCIVEKSWMSWWFYHHRNIFLKQSSPDSMIDWLDQMVWLPGGTINYERTAKKILFCDMLTKVQKFQLACAYCFMDDVERLKAQLTQEEIKYACLGYYQFDDGFSNYWLGRMKNIHLSRYRSFHVAENRSLPDNILSYLLDPHQNPNMLEPYDEWAAIEFCFNECRNEDFWDKVRKIVTEGRPRVIFHILVKLSAFELNSLLKDYCVRIVKDLVKKQNYEYTILIWKHVVHGISDAQLASIITYVNDYESKRKYANSLLLEMWLCTSERQKKYIINERVCDFTKKRPKSCEIEKFPPNLPLILNFLSHCDPERKFEYWSEHWPYLIPQFVSENRTIIDRIMKLCLVDEQKIEDFKKAKMTEYGRIADYCKWFIENDRINEIHSYLEFFTSDLQVIRGVKKTIISGISNSTIFSILFRGSDEKKRDLFQYLDDVFTENESKEFLNEIVTRPENLKQFCIMIKDVTSEKLENMIEILEKYVSSEQNLFKAKQYILKGCYGRTEISISLDLIRWCFNVDKVVMENFKKSESNENVNVGLSRGGWWFGSCNTPQQGFLRGMQVGQSYQRIDEKSNEDSGHYVFDIFMLPYHFRVVAD